MSDTSNHSLVSDTLFDPEFAAREAPLYTQQGYEPIPLNERSKLPIGRDWQKRDYPPSSAKRDFPFGCNLGVRTGTPDPGDSAWLYCAIDFDFSFNDTTSRERILRCLPPNTFPIRSSYGPRLNLHCLTDFEFQSAGKVVRKADEAHPFAVDEINEKGKPILAQIEIRGPGQQQMLGGSEHPGKPSRNVSPFTTRWLTVPLHHYHISELPRLSKFRLQELIAVLAEPTAAIHRLADAAPGSIHDSIVSAAAWMANNAWPDVDVQDRFELLWQQLTEEYDEESLDRTERSFTQEWQTAINTARAKYEVDRRPSKSARQGPGPNGEEPKLRLPRLMADSWRNINTLDGVMPHVDPQGRIRSYSHGYWRERKPEDIRHELLTQFDTLTAKDAHEALNTLLNTLPRLPTPDPDLICTRSGCLSLSTLTLLPHSPDFHLISAVPFDFDPEPSAPVYERFLYDTFTQCSWEDEDNRTPNELEEDAKIMTDTWEEFAGYCLTTSTSLQVMLILVGPTGSGKSTLARTLEWIFPSGEVGAVSLSKMDDSRYHPAVLSKRVNISYETGMAYSEATDFINSTAAGDTQSVRRMREEATEVTSSVKMIFVGNRMMRTNDSSGAIQRRMVTILAPNKREDAESRLHDLPQQLRAESNAIFSRYVIAGSRVLARGRFLSSHFSVRANRDNRIRSDSVSVWFYARCEYDADTKMPNDMLYYDYRTWSIANGFKPVNNIEWGTRVSQINPEMKSKQVRVPGSKARQYVRPIKFQEGVQPELGPGGGKY